MFNVILYQPEIPANTGAIIRLCANAGAQLHLIHPLGFSMEEKKLRRAGLDYHEFVNLKEYDSLEDCLKQFDPSRIFALSTRSQTRYNDAKLKPGDAFVFGPETRGLPQAFLDSLPLEQTLKLPMMPKNRSLNLANTVSILTYEAWRQNDFAGSVEI